jgi:hypothetical protein
MIIFSSLDKRSGIRILGLLMPKRETAFLPGTRQGLDLAMTMEGDA